MRILYVTTVGITMTFFKKFIKELIDEGNFVDIATNNLNDGLTVPDCFKEYGCKIYNIPTSRSPFNVGNIKAIKYIRNLAKNYDIVHCHTPLAGMSTRLACRKLRKKGLKVIYTAHGFHFYNKAPIKNWLIYYPIEKICSKWTDVLITINKDDFELAKSKMKAKRVEYVAGVGLDDSLLNSIFFDLSKKRSELGLSKNDKMYLSIGELNSNKNHKEVIEALGMLGDKSIHYFIAGVGSEEANLHKQAKLNSVNLHTLGYRKDIFELCNVCDLYIHPSFREGLPVALMEALANHATCIGSNIRGCRDLLPTENLFSPFDAKSLVEKIKNHKEFNSLDEKFMYKSVSQKIKGIYESCTRIEH